MEFIEMPKTLSMKYASGIMSHVYRMFGIGKFPPGCQKYIDAL